ncbi:uncharacterized protein METZ01_LOCUS306476, partial [marine metagenome]
VFSEKVNNFQLVLGLNRQAAPRKS